MYSREPCTLYLKREINKCISNIYRLVYLRSNLQIIFMKMSAILYKALFQFPWQLNNKWESQYQNGVFLIKIKKLKFIFCATNNHYLSPLYVKSLFSNCRKNTVNNWLPGESGIRFGIFSSGIEWCSDTLSLVVLNIKYFYLIYKNSLFEPKFPFKSWACRCWRFKCSRN